MKITKKIVTLLLAVMFILGAFALTACGRKLNDVEKEIVGTWKLGRGTLILKEDGYYDTEKTTDKGKFEQDGEGDNKYGHYYVIKLSEANYDLYYYQNDGTLRESTALTEFKRISDEE